MTRKLQLQKGKSQGRIKSISFFSFIFFNVLYISIYHVSKVNNVYLYKMKQWKFLRDLTQTSCSHFRISLMPLQIIIIVNNIYIYVDFLFSAKLIRLLVCGTPGELLSHKGKHDYDPEHENTESDFGLIFHCNLARGPVIVTDETYFLSFTSSKYARVLSRVQLVVTPWTSLPASSVHGNFFRQEYWNGLPCPAPGDLPDPGTEPMSPASPALAGGFFTIEPPRKPHFHGHLIKWQFWILDYKIML